MLRVNVGYNCHAHDSRMNVTQLQLEIPEEKLKSAVIPILPGPREVPINLLVF